MSDFPCCEAPGGHPDLIDVPVLHPAPPAFTLAELQLLRRGLSSYYRDLEAVARWSKDIGAVEDLTDRISLMIRDLIAK